MQNLPQSLTRKLEHRLETGLLRSLPAQGGGIDFSSNDYLGFAKLPEIFDTAHRYLESSNETANGATGSRLISGNHSLYAVAEQYISEFYMSPGALIFNSGYDANIGLFSSVPQKGDVVLYDEYIHASIRDGLRLGNAMAYKYKHNDAEALKMLIERHRAKAAEIYIVTESVFSMDGDSPNLPLFVEMAEHYGCRLIVDEAHAVGIFGTKGQGLIQHMGLEDNVFARVVTFGKGLGCHGAAVLGPEQLREYLVNFARSFIYTTGLPPHSLATIIAVHKCLENEQDARHKLTANIQYFLSEVRRLNLNHIFVQSISAIQCALIAGNDNAKNAALALAQQGFNVKAILSPTVPPGSERLRFCLHSYNTEQQIFGALQLVKAILQA